MPWLMLRMHQDLQLIMVVEDLSEEVEVRRQLQGGCELSSLCVLRSGRWWHLPTQKNEIITREGSRSHQEDASARPRTISESKKKAKVSKIKRRRRCIFFPGRSVSEVDYEGLPIGCPDEAEDAGTM